MCGKICEMLGNFILEQAMKGQRGEEEQLYFFFNLGAR
jgi:hypothetical protein